MDKPEKFEPQTFTLYTGSKPRAQEIDHLITFVGDLPLEVIYRVTVKKGEEGRRDVANRLYQICLGQIVKEFGKDESALAGWCKHRILLPLKFTYAAEHHDDVLMQRAEHERDVCAVLVDRYSGERLYQTFDCMIRSKNPYTSVGLFAQYLDRLITEWSGRGMTFKLKASDKTRALNQESGGDKQKAQDRNSSKQSEQQTEASAKNTNQSTTEQQ